MSSIAPNIGRAPRICMPTWRRFGRKVFQCSLYEAQDVLAEIDDVDVIPIEPGPNFRWSDRWHKRLIFRDPSERLVLANPGLQPVRLERDYELFVAVCQSYEDLTYINAIENWKERCQTSVCWIDEIWAASLTKYRHWLTAFKQFDYVCVGYHGTVEPLSAAIGAPCHWVPGAVDAIRFHPDEAAAPRVIDVYSMGRRWNGVHDALRRMAADQEIFYVYDTFAAAHADAYDHVQHRAQFATMATRSRCFMVAPAKMDAPEETRGQVEIGYRYYEGAAAGAVLIGRRPDCQPFDDMFAWPDVVIDIATDGSDVAEIVRDLSASPERLRAISRQNVAQSVVRHDWLHRWQRIFDIAGIPQSPGMARRDERLQELSRRAARDAAPAAKTFKRHFI